MLSTSAWYNKFRVYFSKHYSRVYAFCDKHKAIIKFIVSGSLAGATDLILLFVFHGWIRIAITLATSLAFILSFFVSFSLQKFWTFRNHYEGKIIHQLSIYLINALWGLAMNAWFMHLLVNGYGIWYILAQIIVNLAIGFWNFTIYKLVIFKNIKNENFL